MSTKKSFLVAALLCSLMPTTQVQSITNPYLAYKKANDWLVRNLTGYCEISEIYYPNTVQYLNQMKEKYPDSFKNVSIFIHPNIGPCATMQSIFLPRRDIQRLEQELLNKKNDGFYTKAYEMILLHEAGHVAHQDVALRTIISSIRHYLILNGIALIRAQQKEDGFKKLGIGLGIGAVSFYYYTFVMEYYADSYAMNHCKDKACWFAFYEFLDRCAPAGIVPGLSHSFKGRRLNKIKEQFKQTFGEEMPVTCHPELELL